MTIRDDGRGFSGQTSAHGPDGHFGLTGMKERAEGIGGTFTVKSNPGAGTEISIEMRIG
jgi:signal transduction histidine kinase